MLSQFDPIFEINISISGWNPSTGSEDKLIPIPWHEGIPKNR